MENSSETHDLRQLVDVSNKRDNTSLTNFFSFDLQQQLDLRTEQKQMKYSGFPEGQDMLSYAGHVCKRFSRKVFTIIPLVGDVRCLIPFVG